MTRLPPPPEDDDETSFFQMIVAPLSRYARSKVNDNELVKDLVQETCAKLLSAVRRRQDERAKILTTEYAGLGTGCSSAERLSDESRMDGQALRVQILQYRSWLADPVPSRGRLDGWLGCITRSTGARGT